MAESDWKSRATPLNGTNDWKARAHNVSPEQYQEEPGMIESGLRGLEQGATLGFGDELNGAMSTLLDTLTGRNKNLSILDDYAKQRDESRAAFKAAEDAHPYISGAANLAGGIAPALLTGGASLPEQGIAGAAKLGALYGAVGGLGNSEADLTRGQVGQSIRDTATGGVMGGVLGGAVHAGAEKFGDALKKAGIGLGTAAKEVAGTPMELPMIAEPVESFKQGLQGQKLYGIKANKDLQQQFINSMDQLGEKLQTAESGAVKNQTNLLSSATDRIDMHPWLKSYNIMNSNLKQARGADEDVMTDLNKIGNYIYRTFQGDENEGLVGQLKPGGMLPKEIKPMLDKLKGWSAVGDESLKTKEGRLLATRLVAELTREPNLTEQAMNIPQMVTTIKAGETPYTPLKPLLNNAVPGLADENATISSIERAKEVLPNINDLMNLEKTGQSGTTSLDAVQKFFDVAPKDVFAGDEEKITSLAKGRDIANKISAPGLSHGFLANTVRGTTLTGANMLGAGLRGLYNMAPEALQDLSKTVASDASAAAQKLSIMLSNASSRDNIGRNALFFAIQQNPEYRKILHNAAGLPPEVAK
jgi:hypothetical protein